MRSSCTGRWPSQVISEGGTFIEGNYWPEQTLWQWEVWEWIWKKDASQCPSKLKDSRSIEASSVKGSPERRWCATFPTLTMAKALQPLWVHLKMQVADGQPILLPLVVTSTGAANNVECERLLRSRSRAPQRCLRIIGCRTTREWNRLTLVGGVDCWWTEVGGETKGRRLII